MSEGPTSLKYLAWPSGFPDGYDVRDLAQDSEPKDALRYIEENLQDISELTDGDSEETESDWIEPEQCDTFDELINHFESAGFDMPQAMRDAFASMLAVILSTRKGRDHLWLYLVGPPSSGKSTLCEAVSLPKYTKPHSKFSGVFSGFKKKGGGDAAPVHRFNHSTLVVKDFTTVFSEPRETKSRLYGELRDAYDGKASVSYRNAIEYDYDDIYFTIIAATTYEVYKEDQSILGERFLKIEILDKEDLRSLARSRRGMKKAMRRELKELAEWHSLEEGQELDDETIDALKGLKPYVLGFLQKKSEEQKATIPAFPEEMEDKIDALAELIANLRTQIPRDKYTGELIFEPVPESSFRLGVVLCRLAIHIAWVFGKESVDDEVYRVVQKVAKDTSSGFPLQVLELLMAQQSEGLTPDDIEKRTPLSKATVERRMNDMRSLGMVKRTKRPNQKGKGRHSKVYKPSKAILKIWKRADL